MNNIYAMLERFGIGILCSTLNDAWLYKYVRSTVFAEDPSQAVGSGIMMNSRSEAQISSAQVSPILYPLIIRTVKHMFEVCLLTTNSSICCAESAFLMPAIY